MQFWKKELQPSIVKLHVQDYQNNLGVGFELVCVEGAEWTIYDAFNEGEHIRQGYVLVNRREARELAAIAGYELFDEKLASALPGNIRNLIKIIKPLYDKSGNHIIYSPIDDFVAINLDDVKKIGYIRKGKQIKIHTFPSIIGRIENDLVVFDYINFFYLYICMIKSITFNHQCEKAYQ